MSETKNVFISHHHKDDASIDGLSRLLNGKDYKIRNSSIRVNPNNQSRLEKGEVSENTIKRLLRMKMKWAGSVIVIVGDKTHTRKWVNWEIEEAQRQGKAIIGVYENGLKDKVPVPEALEKYASAMLGWDSKKIIDALNGEGLFENPDGSVCQRKDGGNVTC